jgi:hypothetical protein
MSKQINFREADPEVAAFIDDLRTYFGAEGINANMKKGGAGIPGFFYYKGPAGEFGTPMPPDNPAKVISACDMVIESLQFISLKRK